MYCASVKHSVTFMTIIQRLQEAGFFGLFVNRVEDNTMQFSSIVNIKPCNKCLGLLIFIDY